MHAVTVSPKYQIVIPRPVRDNLQLRPGQRMQVLVFRTRGLFRSATFRTLGGL